MLMRFNLLQPTTTTATPTKTELVHEQFEQKAVFKNAVVLTVKNQDMSVPNPAEAIGVALGGLFPYAYFVVSINATQSAARYAIHAASNILLSLFLHIS
jgi:hypothetical protein